jgi:putative ABC transport system permease protein
MLQPISHAGSGNGTAQMAVMETISARFFDTVRVQVQAGRDFTWHDAMADPPVAIINSTLAHRLFPRGDVLGEPIGIGTEPSRKSVKIVGIVRDAGLGSVRSVHLPIVYRPWLQEPEMGRYPTVVIRANHPLALTDATRRTVAGLGKEYIRAIQLLDDHIDGSLARERVMAALASFFAAIAIVLAFIGTYGLLTFRVARRTREIGVRMALGADRANVARMIAGEGFRIASVGAMIGIPIALASGRVLTALLFGLAPSDPWTLVKAVGLFLIVGLLAGALPAYRASKVDPAIALRSE